MRRIKLLRLIFINLFIILIFLYLSESVLNYHPLIKSKHQKESKLRFIDLREESFENDGFIFGNTKIKESDIKIFFVGGSSTLCDGIDLDYRFPYYSAKLIKEKTKINYYGINAGRSGNHSMHNNFVILAKIIKYKPKYVFLMNSVNDLGFLTKTKSYWVENNSRSIIKKPLERIYISNKFPHLRNFFPNLYFLIERILVKTNYEFKDYKIEDFNPDEYKLIENQFYKSVKTALAILKTNDIEPILIVQANRLTKEDGEIKNYYNETINSRKNITQTSVEYSDFVDYYKKFNNLIRKIAEDENVFLIDLDYKIPKTKKYLYDAVHLTTDGSILAGEIISKEFIKFKNN